ncbi:MAG: TetR/AcrR family transcriptional regulator [Myxococcota bacterium]
MGRPRASDTDVATPERILAAAAAEFAQHGRERATLADIARRVGIRRPSLLYHYPSKDALYEAVVRDVFARLTAVLAASMQTPETSFEDRLEALVRAYAAFLADHPQHARIVLREMLADDGPGPTILREEIAPILSAVVAFLEVAGGGVLRPNLPLQAAVMQVASDLLLQHAAGAVGPVMWGASSPGRSWQLARALLIAGAQSTPPPHPEEEER